MIPRYRFTLIEKYLIATRRVRAVMFFFATRRTTVTRMRRRPPVGHLHYSCVFAARQNFLQENFSDLYEFSGCRDRLRIRRTKREKQEKEKKKKKETRRLSKDPSA